MVNEPEFSRVLAVMYREGSILEPVVQQLWDQGRVDVMTRANPLKAEGIHLVINGQTTPADLRAKLSEVSMANGSGNRFLFIETRPERSNPNPQAFTRQPGLAPFISDVHRLIEHARTVGEMRRTVEAGRLWELIYVDLNRPINRVGGNEMVAALVQIGPAQVMRLAMLYALLDGDDEIDTLHLLSALEMWAYSERCIAHLYADTTGDRDADTILSSLREQREMDRSEVSDLLGRNWPQERVRRALAFLLEHRLAHYRKEKPEGPGRPREIWTATPKASGIDQTYLQLAREFCASPEPAHGLLESDDLDAMLTAFPDSTGGQG